MSHDIPRPRVMTVPEFRNLKQRGIRATVVTAYDFTSAKLVDAAGVDAILVGDSLGSVIQGHTDTLAVTLNQMLYHTSCVVRAVKQALVIADLPFLSYQLGPKQAVASAGKCLKKGAAAVKLEGGLAEAESVAACVRAGIPIMGHVGMTPQSVHIYGGFKVQRDEERIVADARALEQAGAFALVVECVPAPIASRVRREVSIPIIGIGAGPDCDGQVLVFHDLLGLFDEYRPKFVKRYAELGDAARTALKTYCDEVREGKFPDAAHSFQ